MPSYAHFDADNPLAAAMCLSSFLVSVEDGGLLLGRMQDPDAWKALEPVHSPEHAFGQSKWVLPAAHLRMGEHPDDAARRVAEEQLRASLEDFRMSNVLSYGYALPSRAQDLHWDLCFVYDVELRPEETPAWFAELRRLPLPDVRHGMFARGHGDVLADLNLIAPP